MIETRRASRIRPLGLALSSWRANTSPEGWEVLSQWQSSAPTPDGSTVESVRRDGRPSADRRPARRGALPAPSLRPLPGEDVRPTAHDDGAAQRARAGLPRRRGPPPPRPASASAAQQSLISRSALPGGVARRVEWLVKAISPLLRSEYAQSTPGPHAGRRSHGRFRPWRRKSRSSQQSSRMPRSVIRAREGRRSCRATTRSSREILRLPRRGGP
jgi:hypothetical protein